MKGLVLDLFSGSGSATQPFVECPKGHEVVRVDIAGKPDVRADVRFLPLDPSKFDFAWASPPCTEFSSLTNFRKFHPGKTGPRPELGMPLVRSAFEHVRKARFWVVENVQGAVPHFAREFGRPKFVWAARYCWSNVDLSLMSPPSRWWRKFGRMPSKREPEKLDEFLEMLRRRGITSNTFAGHTAARSMIPRPLAEAIHRAVCEEGAE